MIIIKALKRTIHTSRYTHRYSWRKLYRPLIGGSTVTLGLSWCLCQSEAGEKELDPDHGSSSDARYKQVLRWTKEHYTEKILHSSVFRFGRAAYVVSNMLSFFLLFCELDLVKGNFYVVSTGQ